VELHGGSVTASSAGLGAGSEFIVRLPRAAESAEATMEAAHVPQSAVAIREPA
jgi:hypothetical protein